MRRRRASSFAERHCYEIGRHLLRLHLAAEGWAVDVDGLRSEARYATEVEAWTAGIAAAEQLDLRPPRPQAGAAFAQSASP